jgi:hypothetical protein
MRLTPEEMHRLPLDKWPPTIDEEQLKAWLKFLWGARQIDGLGKPTTPTNEST